jgi:hypothetical protein
VEPQNRGIKLQVWFPQRISVPRLQGVDLFRECQQVRFASAQIDNLDALPGIGAFVCYQMIGKERYVIDHHIVAVRDDFFHPLRAHIIDRGAQDAEVQRAVVGQKIKMVAAVMHRILNLMATRQKHAWCARRFISRNHTHFRGCVAVRCHQDICPAPGQGNVDVKEMIRLFVHQCVRFWIAPDGMAIDAIGTSGIIEGGVEQVLSIAAPGDTIVGIGNRSIQQRTGYQIFDEKRVRFRSIHIDRPGEQASIVRWSKDPDPGKGVPFRQCVDIEEDLFLRVVNGATVHNRVLSPRLSTREVHERSVAIRNAFILLAQSAAHLTVQALTQPGSVRRHLFRVAVFGFKMGDYLRVVALAHPEVVVDHLIAVDRDHVRSPGWNRRCRHSLSLSRMMVQRLSIIGYRLSAISYQLSAIGYRLSAISYR